MSDKGTDDFMQEADSSSIIPLMGLLGAGAGGYGYMPDEHPFARTVLLTRINCFKDNYTAVKALRAWKEVADDLIKACEYIFPAKEDSDAHER